MSPVLKLKGYNETREIMFELNYLASLTTRQRFEMMLKKTEEMRRLLEKSGHRKPFEIIKRTQDLEDLKMLKRIKRLRHKKGKEIRR